jgi:hypothetical protein
MKSLLPFLCLLLPACGKLATEPDAPDAAPLVPVVPVPGQHEIRLPNEVVLGGYTYENQFIAFTVHPTDLSASPPLGKDSDPWVTLIANVPRTESRCLEGRMSSKGLDRLASRGFARIRAIDLELSPDEQDGRPSVQDQTLMCFGVRTEGGRWEWRPKHVELVYDTAEKRLRGHFELDPPIRADAVKLLAGHSPRLFEHPVDRVTYEVVE